MVNFVNPYGKKKCVFSRYHHPNRTKKNIVAIRWTSRVMMVHGEFSYGFQMVDWEAKNIKKKSHLIEKETSKEDLICLVEFTWCLKSRWHSPYILVYKDP